ncbi:MAG: hypothetical protein P1U64_09040 [Alcanivoracaceae bacterium]|nr:hypothetical protein [Alcanivoracaceae bacterium]
MEVIVMPDPGSIILHGSGGDASDLGPRILFSEGAESPCFAPISQEKLSAIRKEMIRVLLFRNIDRCVFPASERHHFSLPSGAHVNMIVRVQDALVDMESVDLIAYWCAIEVRKFHGRLSFSGIDALIMVDNPGLLLLAARLSAFLNLSAQYHSFLQYGDVISRRGNELSAGLSLSKSHTVCVFICGLSLTGSMSFRVKEMISARRNKAGCVINVLSLSDSVEAFSNIRIYGYHSSGPGQVCGMCEEGSHPIPVDQSTYAVRLLQPLEVSLPPSKFSQQKEFIASYGGVPGVLRVHYDDPNEYSPRHHAFYIDVGSLIESSDFRSELLSKLSALVEGRDAILVPDHGVGRKIASILSTVFLGQIVMIPSDVSLTPAASLAIIRKSLNLLVVDDKFITGSRFDGINRYIRESEVDLSVLDFFAIVATPPSQARYDQRLSGLTTNHPWDSSLSFKHFIMLPNWENHEDCPWCNERDYLTDFASEGDALDSIAADRIGVLSRTRIGLSADCFFAPAAQDFPSLGNGSVAGPEGLSPLQVLFAFVSAVQQKRQCPTDRLDVSSFPQPSCLAKKVFSDHYTERLIWLALLRCLKEYELAGDLKAFLREEMTKTIEHNRDSFARFELFIASALHGIDMGSAALDSLKGELLSDP